MSCIEEACKYIRVNATFGLFFHDSSKSQCSEGLICGQCSLLLPGLDFQPCIREDLRLFAAFQARSGPSIGCRRMTQDLNDYSFLSSVLALKKKAATLPILLPLTALSKPLRTPVPSRGRVNASDNSNCHDRVAQVSKWRLSCFHDVQHLTHSSATSSLPHAIHGDGYW